jgi:DNA-binding transcriptional MerR regulator
MIKKNNLLSIGDISKLSGASQRSIRYYERIGLLKPIYINPDSGYRYYSLKQAYLIEMIKFCIEMDIPLKVLKEYVDENGVMDFTAIAAYGKEMAEKKIKTLNQGLELVWGMEEHIALAEQYGQDGQVYTRDISEKIYYTLPLKESFEDVDPLEIAKEFLALEDSIKGENFRWESGLLCEYSPDGTSQYIFIEMKKRVESRNIKIIPAGTYFCIQNDESKIEQVSHIFKEQLAGEDSFLVIEIGIFTGKHNISKPKYELRVIAS